MAHDRRGGAGRRGIGRREAIALFGLLTGMASAALLTGAVAPREPAVRVAI